MNKFARNYTKKELIKFLQEIYVENDDVIKRIENLPENLEFNQTKYNLNIIKSWQNEYDTYYEFELNYYSSDTMEFLFKYEIFSNIETSLNHIEYELDKLKK